MRLRQHLLRAPFSGVIKARWCETGEWLQPGQAVLELVEPNKLWLEVQVPQEKFSQVTAANRIDIETDMQPELSLVGQIAALVPVSDSSARSFLLRLAFTDPAAVVQAGTSGRAIYICHLYKAAAWYRAMRWSGIRMAVPACLLSKTSRRCGIKGKSVVLRPLGWKFCLRYQRLPLSWCAAMNNCSISSRWCW